MVFSWCWLVLCTSFTVWLSGDSGVFDTVWGRLMKGDYKSHLLFPSVQLAIYHKGNGSNRELLQKLNTPPKSNVSFLLFFFPNRMFSRPFFHRQPFSRWVLPGPCSCDSCIFSQRESSLSFKHAYRANHLTILWEYVFFFAKMLFFSQK